MTCNCHPKIEWRDQPKWNRGWDLYGYGVGVLVKAHTGRCDLPDEVLATRVVRV